METITELFNRLLGNEKKKYLPPNPDSHYFQRSVEKKSKVQKIEELLKQL